MGHNTPIIVLTFLPYGVSYVNPWVANWYRDKRYITSRVLRYLDICVYIHMQGAFVASLPLDLAICSLGQFQVEF